MSGRQPERRPAPTGVDEAGCPASAALDSANEVNDITDFRMDTQAVNEVVNSVEKRRNFHRDRRRQNGAIAQRRRRTHFVPLNWPRIGFVIAPAYFSAMILGRGQPSALVCVLGLAAILLTAIGGRIARWERSKVRQVALDASATVACVVLPHVLVGLGFAIWMFHEGLDVRIGIGSLVAINAVSATLLMRRTPLLFTSFAATWVPVALVDGSLMTVGMTVLVAIVLFVVSQMQINIEQQDLIELQERERTRNRYEDILRDYEETGQGWFWETNRRGQLNYLSPTVADTVGRRHEELLGKPFLDLFDLCDLAEEGERTLTFHLAARSSFQELAIRVAIAGEERWWSVSGRPLYDDFHNFVGFCGSGTDLTEKRLSEESASRLAHYDSLTGLANRFQMAKSLGKILDAPQERQRDCAVLLLDLDRFKDVNDTLGHPAGDALLKQVSQRLETVVGAMGRVGRVGGDEFKVVIPGSVERHRLGELSQEIIHSLSQRYLIEGQKVSIGVSIGIAVSPDDGVTSEALIRNADLALYAAKGNGRGRSHFYSNNLHSAAEERVALESDLRDAIAQGALELYYQPVVHLATERITGFEALLRWNHPTKGWLSPDIFIPIAEDTGLIPAIGEWAIRTACQELARWPEDVRCAVNVSALQFSNPQLPAIVTHALAQAGVAPSRLELEITESVFLNDQKGTDAMFAALKAVGVRLALDDFGTGYSSLGYLKKAPFDKIKIDQSFVRGVTEPGSRNGAIIASITNLAQALGMDTTAEGVETIDELDLVRKHGCSHVQGHIYEEPLCADQAHARLASGQSIVAAGPKSARPPRVTVLRKVVLENDGNVYSGTIRNISAQGILIEGLSGVPEGTTFEIAISDSITLTATCRWSEGARMGVELSAALERDADGVFVAIKTGAPDRKYGILSPPL